ncbi:MAG: hypothetical protein AAB467_02045 [Patescibacteria group bacterium]
MKWYKKQIDQIKIDKPELFKTDETPEIGTPKHTFEEKKMVIKKPAFTNPVTMRNVNRPKTDA